MGTNKDEITALAEKISTVAHGYSHNTVISATLNVCAVAIVDCSPSIVSANEVSDAVAGKLREAVRNYWSAAR